LILPASASLVICTLIAAVTPPAGFRYPSEADRTHDWHTFKEQLPTPYRAEADFNGDGVSDEAWILLGESDDSWGLFVFLGERGGLPEIIKLHESDGRSVAEGQGITVIEPGEYLTACGKGYWECEPDEPEKLMLSLPAINFFHFESANSFFWWDEDSGQFRETWMSD